MGSLIRLLAIAGGYNGSYWLLAIGHAIIGIATITLMISSLSIISKTKRTLRKWYICGITGSIPAGLFIG
jgi:hypothetical protein